MELGAEGSRSFLRIMRLAGIPEGERDAAVVQKGRTARSKRKVVIAWER